MTQIAARGKRETFVGRTVVGTAETAPLAAVVLNGQLTDPTNRALLGDELQAFEGGSVVLLPIDRWTPFEQAIHEPIRQGDDAPIGAEP